MTVEQKEIDQVKTGMLLLVKLLNYDELNIIVPSADTFINKFQNLIQKSCEKISNCIILKTSIPSEISIILPDDLRLAEKLAYLIYSDSQLYVDQEFPNAYFRCATGSIKFFPEQKLGAEKLKSILMHGISSSRNQNYYYSYDDNPINLDDLQSRNANVNLLRSSLLKKKIKFAYQPIIERKSGNIEYYECLLRVDDGNNNFVSVGSMIEDAEEKGLIGIIDFTVINMVIAELVKEKDIKLSVNISNSGVLSEQLLKKIKSLLNKHPVADRLIIEITETSLNHDFATTKKFIDTLHKYGCRFALDDFGSGFTSFKQLTNLPIDIIKIDGSYIRDILSNNHSKFFVEALIGLATDLGIKTVAEFVENAEIAQFLTETKIDGMQGNFFLPASCSRDLV